VDNKYGCDALERIYDDFAGETDGAMPGVQVWFQSCRLAPLHTAKGQVELRPRPYCCPLALSMQGSSTAGADVIIRMLSRILFALSSGYGACRSQSCRRT
jgi:hypothetical protein